MVLDVRYININSYALYNQFLSSTDIVKLSISMADILADLIIGTPLTYIAHTYVDHDINVCING